LLRALALALALPIDTFQDQRSYGNIGQIFESTSKPLVGFQNATQSLASERSKNSPKIPPDSSKETSPFPIHETANS
jgi:hypothetical protein